ncbi:MAG: SUMF1/EgtB/PvdO family nonheme iron enzyme [Pseudomonadota bacterium]|nr:SUMF1/EgtB/PvdO family nonheme iron enzyme [Pseudomonadota bacterium]
MSDPLEQLQDCQRQLLAACLACPEPDRQRQWHDDLSPLGWHLGHAACVETLWLREHVGGQRVLDAEARRHFFPENLGKTYRSRMLPPWAALSAWVTALQAANLQAWRTLRTASHLHPLLAGDYLLHFIIQHYAQHLETVRLVLEARALTVQQARPAPRRPAGPAQPAATGRWRTVVAGDYLLGATDHPAPYDNELPAQRLAIDGCQLAERPVTNGEYLRFIEDGGYAQRDCWSPAGWAWRCAQAVGAPWHWRRTSEGWVELGTAGVGSLAPAAPLHGICWYEAQAYARWRGARLPSADEWEAAAGQGLLREVGVVWEWCASAFAPRPGFAAFPYRGYSTPWFDGAHRELRGGSSATPAPLRRTSFRNFYTSDKRHIRAGVRLARDLA